MTKPTIKPHSVILFQGDSITDVGRSRSAIGANSPDGMGFGYPSLAAEELLAKFPDYFLQCYNRGISGDRIRDMSHRWERDSLRLVPDLISILIGVNDTWNHLFMGLGSDPEDFKKVYHQLLTNTRLSLPETMLVLCEPFILLTGEVTEEWSIDISQRQAAVQDLAREFDALFVPFQTALDEESGHVSAHKLLEDGVHPTEIGHRLLADCWVKTVLG